MRLIIHTFSCLLAFFLYLTAVPAHAQLLDCTGCHAGPGDMRPLDAPYRKITTGGFRGNHRTHMPITATATACAICHNNSNFQTNHRNNQIQLASKIANYSGIYGKAAYRTSRPAGSDGSSIFFNQTSVPMLASCTNANCHFETTTPIWGTDATAAGFNCSSCHGNPPAGTPGNNYFGGAAGSHETHGSLYTFTCSKCHSDHTKDAVPFGHATSIGKRNLVVTPEFGTYTSNRDRNYLPGQADSHTFGTCAGTYCHSTGSRTSPPFTAANGSSPRWGDPSSAVCGSCHKATDADPIATGSHAAHFNLNNYGPKMGATISACQGCHAYSNGAATHVNGTVNKTPCIPCHPGTEPAWGAVNTACQNCHGKFGTSVMNNMSAPDKWRYATQQVGLFSSGNAGVGGHFASPNFNAFGITCSSATWCHRNHSLTSPEPGHISGIRGDYRGLNSDMDPRTGLATAGNFTCACHITATKRSHVASHNESTPSMVCNKCHDAHGSGNLQMIRAGIWYDPALPPTAISFSNRSTFVKYTAPYDGLCQTCHTQTAHFKRGVAEPAAAGQHGNITNRACTSCHKHGVDSANNVAFAFQSPRCDTCHGYPPVSSMNDYGTQNKFSTAKIQNYPNSGGAHTAFGHLAATIKATDLNPWQPCLPCHAGGATTHRLAAAAAQVQISGTYNGKTGSSGYSSTCSNVSCHGGAATVSGTSPTWASTPGWFLPNGDINLFAEGRLNNSFDTLCLQCHTINTADRLSGTPENNSPYSGWDPDVVPYYANLHESHIDFYGFTCTECHSPGTASLGKNSTHFTSLSTATMGRAWQSLNPSLSYTPYTSASAVSRGTCGISNGSCHPGYVGPPHTW